MIVTDHGAAVGFVVDRIDDLLALAANQVEKDDAGAGSIDPHLLDGVVKGAEGDTTIKILNPQRLLRDEFARLGISGPRGVTPSAIPAAASAPAAAEPQQQVSLVSFDLGGQEYALPLDRVREIIPLPDQVSEVPRSETAVLGVVTLRDRLLPLVSLRALLGLPSDDQREERGKVVVLSMGSGAVGMVADRTREIIRIDPGLIDPAPALLTRGEGDAEITSICRLDHGRRLVAVLSPDRLFRSDLVRRVLSEQGSANDDLERQTDHECDGRRAVRHLPAGRPGVRAADRGGGRDRASARSNQPASESACLHRRRDESCAAASFRSSTCGGGSIWHRRNPGARGAFSSWRSGVERRVSWSTASLKS